MFIRMLRPFALSAALALMFAPVALAHDVAPSAATGAIQTEFNSMLTDAEQKIIELAETVPPGKYEWAPDKEARKFSELFMHVAAANYFLPTFFGQQVPQGIEPMKFESTIKEKPQVVQRLRESFAAAHKSIDATKDLDTMVDVFGRQVTKRYAMLLLVSHAHEHLGQAIAYARSNDITPPWTERREAAAQAKADAAKK